MLPAACHLLRYGVEYRDLDADRRYRREAFTDLQPVGEQLRLKHPDADGRHLADR